MVASPGDGQPGLPNPGEDEEMGKHRKSKDRAVRKAIKLANKRPKITLKVGKLPVAVDRAEAALLAHCEKLGIFQRAGELVRVISLPERVADGLLSRPKGSVQLELLGKTALTEIFNRIAKWRRQKSNGNIIRVDCPPKIATFYISRVGFWRVPALSGIISASLLRRDGSVLENPGYDSSTGLYLLNLA
jgi:hypothetical protein